MSVARIGEIIELHRHESDRYRVREVRHEYLPSASEDEPMRLHRITILAAREDGQRLEERQV
jgi:hypothetical protein